MAATCCLLDCRSSLENKGVKLFKLTDRRKNIWKKALMHHSMSEKKGHLNVSNISKENVLEKEKNLKKAWKITNLKVFLRFRL